MLLRTAIAAGILASVLAATYALRPSDNDAKEPRREGRIPQTHLPGQAQGTWTLLTFSSALCLACRETPRILDEAVPEDASLQRLRLDIANHPQLVQDLNLHSTPTLILLDPGGQIRYAHEGNPNPARLRDTLTNSEEALARKPETGSV